MKIYLVGGAVRDEELGLPVKERDYVVVGGTQEEMLAQGFLQVGKAFPVFLHPQSKEEYALARTEKKVGAGYYGFDFEASKFITLEEDLKRRDITINAMAKSEEGQIIDPFGGLADCKAHLIRHVSSAFVEDPVRVLRVARFAARFHHLGFKVAKETITLMQEIAQSGELDHLVGERVVKEMQVALNEKDPVVFFQVLKEANALDTLFPEVKTHYAEVEVLLAKNSLTALQRFALLCAPFSQNELQTFLARYSFPSNYQQLSKMVVAFYADFEKAREFNANHYVTLLEKADAFRRYDRFLDFLKVCEVIFKKKFPVLSPNEVLPTIKLCEAYEATKNLDNQAIIKARQGQNIKEVLHAARVKIIQSLSP